jgi:peptidoglycan-N-acetylglucosamine deacetylase
MLRLILLFSLMLGILGQALGQSIINHGPRTTPKIALTFDGDMTPGMRQLLLGKQVKSYNNTNIYSILERYQVKATFFLSGLWIETYPQQTRWLAKNPLFELANHSYSHPGFVQPCYGLPTVPLAGLTLKQAKVQQVLKTQKLLEPMAQSRYFRFPGGCASPADVALVQSLGLKVVHWDVIGGDGGEFLPERIVSRVLSGVKNGSIIVLHNHGGPRASATDEALEVIIPRLKARGFIFVKLSELLP